VTLERLRSGEECQHRVAHQSAKKTAM
jgi:hypothetical protein